MKLSPSELFRIAIFSLLSASISPLARADLEEDFLPDQPVSDYLPAAPGEPPVDFCHEWNPEFAFRGFKCCSDKLNRQVASNRKGRRTRGKNSCAPDRIKWSFCDEMSTGQKHYIDDVKSGKIPDVLAHLDRSRGSAGAQAFCGASNGFLANGRPLIATEKNLIELRNPARCANFGTDGMVGMMEWVGREIKREYFEKDFSKIRLIAGDLSAPRGGCVSGRFGRRAHKSHTGGQDIDLAFFNPRANHPPEERFTRTFYVASNWWFLKKVFKNPYACVKVVFIDKKHIAKLARYAKDDPEWAKLSKYIRHVRGHRDHFHIRVGDQPGAPGCYLDPDLEEDEDISDAPAEGESDAADGQEGPEEEGALPSGLRVQNGQPATEIRLGLTSAETQTVESAKALIPHKMEPLITAQYEEKSRRLKRRPASHKRRR